ncbi:cytochrome b-c1 complex subunit 2, mitochondrial [Cylas formicarius]|uniref:cytochrome b-c1 complex subunit 2, mitochondrial n=1 Tax=Cylas formicarius TaxID=197179 RepID=UPI002958B7AB|nr:cytochrome b-c1 complex subunit 2, mitochondrial [Cylas formicarius]
MASQISKGPLFRIARGYTQLAPIGGVINYDLKSTVLPNRVVVVSGENDSAIARVSIIFRAGARNETADNLGVSHVLRSSAGLSTRNATQFAITRHIQQVGASLTATSDRETITYTLEGLRQAVEAVLPFLTEVATQQVFKFWEVSDLSHRLKLDIAVRPLQLRAIDLLHKAAFRTGLGNSLFIPKFNIGKISTETLQHYVASNFVSGRAAVVGLGFSSSKTLELAQSLNVETGDGTTVASPYKGGEVRSDKGGEFAYVAIAGEGASLKNTKEAVAAAVFQRALGVGPQIKWGVRDNGLLSRSVDACGDFASSAINANYSDTGLVGVLLVAPAASAGKVVEGAVKVLKNPKLTDADVNRGKAQLKAAVLSDFENGSKAVQLIGSQAALTGGALSPVQIAAEIDSITTTDVSNVAQKAGRKLTFASVGNLSHVPYADDLK